MLIGRPSGTVRSFALCQGDDRTPWASFAPVTSLVGPWLRWAAGADGRREKEVQLRSHFKVLASKAPAALPAPAAVERTIEFGFKGPKTLHDGELVAFENEGFLVHMDLAFPVKSMKAAKTAVRDLQTITAKPGIYVQVCFMQTQDGRDHTRLGMERIIKITR
jgi:hypothetical protein